MQTTTPTSMPMARTSPKTAKPKPRRRSLFTDKELDRFRRPGTVQRKLFD